MFQGMTVPKNESFRSREWSQRRVAWYTTRCSLITQKFLVWHLTARSVKVPCPVPNRQIWFSQHFQHSHSLSVGLRSPSWFFSISIQILTWEIYFSHSKYNALYVPNLCTSNQSLHLVFNWPLLLVMPGFYSSVNN